MIKKEIYDDDVVRVLSKDGVNKVVIHDFENLSSISLSDLKKKMGKGSWAVRVIYNDIFGGVLIKQNPGEGNRLHCHRKADESWVILEGEWEWYIEGIGTKKVSVNDIVVVRKGDKHKITCVGDKPAIRLAITMPDVDHVYAEEQA
jgi:mannose-6-phosphate isomerase-like protein (cupin superfamily)